MIKIEDIKMVWGFIKRRPVLGILSIILTLAGIYVVGPFCTSFFSEKGKLGANISYREKEATNTGNEKGFTLAGDIDVYDNYVQIEGINQKGNLNYKDTEGGSVSQMTISSDDQNKGGNLNIIGSRMKNVINNNVKRDTNIVNSDIENIINNNFGLE